MDRPFERGVKKFTEWSVKQRTRPALYKCPSLQRPNPIQLPNDTLFVVAQRSKF